MRRLRVIVAAVTAAAGVHALLALGLSRVSHGQPVQLVAPVAAAPARADKPAAAAPPLAASPPAAPPLAASAARLPVEKLHARRSKRPRPAPAPLPVFDIVGIGTNVDDGGGTVDDAR